MRIVTWIERQPKPLQAAESLAALALMAALDYVTGAGFSVLLLYSLLVFVVAWLGTRRFALVFAVLCGACWWLANMNDHHFYGRLGFAWAAASRLAQFIFVAVGTSALRTKQEADRQRIEALERAKDLESQIARASESEQRRIGQDLHDGVCQTLAAIRCAVSSTRDDLAEKGLPEAGTVGEVADMLGDVLVEIRNLARGIFPVQMEAAGLPAVLDELAENLRRLHRVQVDFTASPGVKIAPPETAMHLYRIAQEAMSNAIKHGQATHLDLRLVQDREATTLTIADNGHGFTDSHASGDGMGLKTMRYRAQLIGADLAVHSQPQGVVISCRIPAQGPALSEHSPPSK